MPYNPRGAFTRLETIGCRSGVAVSDPGVPSITRQTDKVRNQVATKSKRVSSSRISVRRDFSSSLIQQFADSIGPTMAPDIRRPSSDEVSYFATFGTYIIRRNDIGS